jgi:hypothetical protein
MRDRSTSFLHALKLITPKSAKSRHPVFCYLRSTGTDGADANPSPARGSTVVALWVKLVATIILVRACREAACLRVSLMPLPPYTYIARALVRGASLLRPPS